MSIKELRTRTGMSQRQFAKYFNIPKHTLQNWEQGQRKCPEYLLELMEYKLEKEQLLLFSEPVSKVFNIMCEFFEEQDNKAMKNTNK